MDNNVLYFSLSGKYDNNDISPDNSSLQALIDLSTAMGKFIKGSSRNSLKDVSIAIKHGSLAIVASGGDSLTSALSDYSIVKESGSLDGIDPARATILRELQEKARKALDSDYVFTISDGANARFDSGNSLSISKDSNYKTSKEDVWAETDIYQYGTIVDIGGKTKTNVHLVLEDGKTIVMDANTQLIANDRKNRLYRKQLVKIKAEQNLETGKTRNERLESFLEYDPKFNEDEFNRISLIVERSWADVPDISAWVEEQRGNHAQVA